MRKSKHFIRTILHHLDSILSVRLRTTVLSALVLSPWNATTAGVPLDSADDPPQGPSTQEQATPTPDTSRLREITVTGTRIRRSSDFSTDTPTSIITSETMNQMGVVNVGEALNIDPANISTFTPANTGNSNFFSGAYIANLRGLNPFYGSRTLVMIDTQRVVQSTQGDSFDLNLIPQILVNRIDVVTGGASAAYGSGAIAGVVNVRLDKTLEGGKIDGDFFETSRSDAKDGHIGAAYGHAFLDDRVHVVIGGEHEHQDGLGCETARPWCAQNAGLFNNGASLSVGSYSGSVTPIGYGTNLRFNQTGYGGVIFNATPGATSTLQGSPDGASLVAFNLGLNPYSSSPGSQRNVVPRGDGIPLYQYDQLLAPNKRDVVMGSLTAQLNETLRFNAAVNWGQVATQTIAPDGLIDQGESLIPADNAYVQTSPALQAALGSTPTLSINKDWTSQVPYFTDVHTTVQRATVGLEGKIGQSSWIWDTYLGYGITRREQLAANNIHQYELPMALDTVLVNGQPECRVTAYGYAGAVAQNPSAAYSLAGPTLGPLLAEGCVPINPLGTKPLSAAALNYAFGNLDERLRYQQTVAAVNASGEYFGGIGAGAFTAAAGVEWRRELGHNDESSCAASDSQCNAVANDFLIKYGDAFGGNVTVEEAYIETSLPLLKDFPGAHLFQADFAVRQSRYDNRALYGDDVPSGQQAPDFIHNLTTWKASAVYEPTEDVRLRVSRSRDARAANFRELYYGEKTAAGGFLGYCNPLGVFAAPSQLDPCTQFSTGNVDLRPETSDTTTVGIILTPNQYVRGLQFSADWFRIRIENAIEAGSVALVESQCRAGIPSACANIQFTPGTGGAAAYAAGSQNIQVISAPYVNGAYYVLSGVDYSLHYLTDFGRFGTLDGQLLATWMTEQKWAPCRGGIQFGCYTYNLLGQTGNANSFPADYTPDPKWRGVLLLNWTRGPLSITPSMNFVGRGHTDYLGVDPSQPTLYQAALKNPNLLGPGIDLHPIPNNDVPAYFLLNFNAAYRFALSSKSGLQVYVHVNNVLDKAPPFAGGIQSFGIFNQYGGTNPILYDTLGRAWRAGFRLRF